jgi:hypothetical protein
VDAASGAVRELPADGVVAFFWSPDGSRIATIGVPSQAAPGSARGPRVTAFDARLASVSRDEPRSRPPAEAPGVAAGLTFVDVAAGTASPEQLVQLSPLFVNQVLPYFDQYALSHRVWSPDGASILLPLVGDDGVEALHVLPADGSPPTELAPGSMGFWSP